MRAALAGVALLAAAALLLSRAPASLSRQQAGPDKRPAFTKQTLNVDGEEVKIVRDGFGVPHVLADTERGAYYGAGYAVAQDRLYQLERFRRDARGTLAELEGGRAIARDRQVRTLGHTEEELSSQFNALKDDVRQAYQSYADGINAYFKEAAAQGRVPEALKAAGIDEPAPWKVTDSVAVGVLMSFRFGTFGGAETLNAEVLGALREKYGERGARMFDDIFWRSDPRAATTVPDGEKPAANGGRQKSSSGGRQKSSAGGRQRSSAGGSGSWPAPGWTAPLGESSRQALAGASDESRQTAVYEYAREHGLPTKWGSYCWVISPGRSASGSAILVGGPQMGFTNPQIGHEIHYSIGGLNVVGMGFPGVPGVVVGHNDHLAWSITSGSSDTEDNFVEKLNPANKYQYLHKGAYRDMEKRVEVIQVKGSEPRRVEVYRTVHGPVVGWDEKAGVAYTHAVSFAGRQFGDLEALHRLNRAKDIREFAAAAEHFSSNYNLFAATAGGDIGYWHCGKPPVRAAGHDQRLPTPGTGEHDWLGLVPFSQMPQVVNPRQGYIVNWNNQPSRSWANSEFPFWGEVSNTRRIEQLIRSRPLLTFEQARDIAQDIGTNDIVADYFKPRLLAAVEKTGAAKRDARVGQAAAYLRAWDNHGVQGSVAKTIFVDWYHHLRDAIFADDLRAAGPMREDGVFSQLVQPSLMLHALDGAGSGVRPSFDYFNGRDRDEVVVEALVKTLDELTRARGPQMNLWGFDQGQIEFRSLPGIPRTDRGTYIQAVELSKPVVRGESILPPGQSENPASPHHADQREMAGYWRFKPMLYRRERLDPAPPAPRAADR